MVLRFCWAAPSLAALREASKLGIAIAAIIGTITTTATRFVTNPAIAKGFPPYCRGKRIILFSATPDIVIPTIVGIIKMPTHGRRLRIPSTSEEIANPVFNSAGGVA
jgi:hypothetical protein